MKEKPTDDLTEELMSRSNLDEYIKANQRYFSESAIAELLLALYNRKQISKAALARMSGMSEVYLHQVFSGRRNPSRDRLLCLCIGLGATFEETQEILKQAGYAQIYPKIKRDAIIGYGIAHQIELNEINDRLFAENEKTLS